MSKNRYNFSETPSTIVKSTLFTNSTNLTNITYIKPHLYQPEDLSKYPYYQ